MYKIYNNIRREGGNLLPGFLSSIDFLYFLLVFFGILGRPGGASITKDFLGASR